MKKLIASVLAILMLFPLNLVSCTQQGNNSENSTSKAPEASTQTVPDSSAEPTPDTSDTPDESTAPEASTSVPDTTTEPENSDTTEAPEATTEPDGGIELPVVPLPQSYTVTESYLPKSVAAELKKIFENRSTTCLAYAVTNDMPYAIADVTAISNGKMLSITIPVVKTGAADANGDFLLTMYVVGNTDTGLKSQTNRTVEIKVNGKEYGLSANSEIYKFVKVDLTEYDITLSDKETVAFFSSNDTLYPAYLNSASYMTTVLKTKFDRATGYYNNAGESGLRLSENSLLFDFEFERTVVGEANRDAATDFEAVVNYVKNAYSGKIFSILGDSISTFDGYSNNSIYNSTIGSNVKLYPYGNVKDYLQTYWGRLITDLNMRLCVNNSWSASHVVGSNYGNYMWNYVDNMLGRATELHRTSGKNPDVIFVFMSTNDLLHPNVSNFGSLYSILTNNDGRTDAQKIEEWLAPVVARAEGSTSITPFTSWDEAYALSLKAMSEKYTEAEIFCMTLLPNTNSGYDKANREKFNRCITALAEYFGITSIDLNEGGIDSEHLSTTTVDGLHPNVIGFSEIEKIIIKALYAKLIAK